MIDAYIETINLLENARHVLVTTHVRPDGDALGSTAALVSALRQKKIRATVLLLSHLPTKYRFIYEENAIDHIDAEAGLPDDFSLNTYDAFVAVDTGTWSQLPLLREHVTAFNGPRLVIDHHLTQDAWATVQLVERSAAAAGEIIARLLERWEVALDVPMATALYLAIVSDTGWFQFSNTTPETLRLAARLIESGCDTDRLQRLIYQNERPERLRLQVRAMGSMELLAGERVSVMTLSPEDFTESRAAVADTEGVVNFPLQIKSVEISLLFTKSPEPGPVRISFRGKGSINCSSFAGHFGGGGHARAAGAKFDGTLADAKSAVIAKLLQSIET